MSCVFLHIQLIEIDLDISKYIRVRQADPRSQQTALRTIANLETVHREDPTGSYRSSQLV